MAAINSGDYDALIWVQDEVQESLASSLQALTTFIDAPEDSTVLNPCVTQLHQVTSTMERLNLQGAHLLVREMLASAIAIRDQQNTQIQDSLLKGLLLLPNYLTLIGPKLSDHPLRLLDSINELRIARNDSIIEINDVFTPNLSIDLPSHIVFNSERDLPNIGLSFHKISHAFQISLLNWIKTDDRRSLRKMAILINYLRLNSTNNKPTTFWWIAEGFIEAILDDGLVTDSKVKLIMGKLNQPIKLFTTQGEQQLLALFPDKLTQQLLLLLAEATSGGETVSTLKELFHLDFFDPQQHHQIYNFGDNALADVHTQLLDQLQEIKEQIDQFNRYSDDVVIEALAVISEKFSSMADTLILLAESATSTLLQHQSEQLKAFVSSQQRPDDEKLLSLADVLLQAEIQLQKNSGVSGSTADNDQLLRTVVGECLNELNNIKETLALLENRPDGASEILSDAATQVELMADSIRMLNMDYAATLLTNTALQMKDTSDRAQKLTSDELGSFAEVIAAIELYMEGFSQHGQQQLLLLDRAQHILSNFEVLDTDDIESIILDASENLTSVERYIQAQAEIETNNIAPPVEDKALEDRVLESSNNLTGVERYIQAQREDQTPQFAEGIDAEIAEIFIEEVNEVQDELHTLIPTWIDQHDLAILTTIRRHFHTLKGGGRMAGANIIGELSWSIENLLNQVIEGRHSVTPTLEKLLLDSHQIMPELLSLFTRGDMNSTEQVDELAIRAYNLISAEEAEEAVRVIAKLPPKAILPVAEKTTKSAPVEQVRVRSDLLDFLTNFAGGVIISRDRVSHQNVAMRQQLVEMESTVERLQDQLRNLEIETEAQILFRYEDEALKQQSEFDTLELDRFSMMQQLSRELTESVSDLNDITQSLNTLVRESDTILLQQSRLSTGLQQGLMTRLLPFTGLVPRFERIVRQTNDELGKKSKLTIYGADYELDRTILDHLVAPIEHILRNAIAHGIESEDQRKELGKEEIAQLTLTITRDGTEILITLSDDGQGINVEKIRQKALEQNLIDSDNMPSDEELIQLILSSGFSTADNVSQLAGRGVGMDVVSNEIRALKGRLSIQSIVGQGTTFTIRLPMTLSIIRALLVSSHDQQYAIPLAAISGGERITVNAIKALLEQDKAHYEFNGEQYRFIALANLLDRALKLPDEPTLQLPLLLFKYGDIQVAILVDSINSNREIVLKSVGEQLGQITAINGATILGDGQVVFILDIPTLIDSVKFTSPHEESEASELALNIEEFTNRTPLALVVDDSITMRKASTNMLKRHGFDVTTARDGVDAVSQLNEQIPDIILLDVEMPRMDGFEFATLVRNDSDLKDLPIIMITSRTGDKHRDRAMNIGVNAYMGKPYQETEIVETLQKLLGDKYPTVGD